MLAVDRFDLTSEEQLDGAAKGARVDRLDQLRVGVDALGQEPVGLPVEEQQDRRVGDAAGRSLEPQVDGDRETTHVADLHVEDDEVGLLLADHVADGLASGDLDDLLTPRGARGLHQVANPLGVRGDDDRAHGGNASRHP